MKYPPSTPPKQYLISPMSGSKINKRPGGQGRRQKIKLDEGVEEKLNISKHTPPPPPPLAPGLKEAKAANTAKE